MNRLYRAFWRGSPLRVLLESWLLCLLLLIPLLPVLFNTPPLPRSLYLVILPLICAAAAGLRLRFFSDQRLLAVGKEIVVAVVLALGILGIVTAAFAAAGQMDAIRFSYVGAGGTRFFICMAIPEHLAMRCASWAWQRWNRLRRRRYAWSLTHSILVVVGWICLFILIAFVFLTANAVGKDIWGIPPEDPFAQLMFWSSVIIMFSAVLLAGGLVLLLPPITLFSFLVARRQTTRIEDLVKGTHALSEGELSTRVAVQGEDEIAQLQADFNAMAADLEKSVQDLQAEKEKVWSLLEARRELVAGISHELRNPIAIINSYLESLERGLGDLASQDVAHDLVTIRYEASRLQIILTDLLTASKMEAGHLEVKPEQVDVGLLAQRVADTFSGLAWRSKRVQVNLDPPKEAVTALADPLRLEQVLVNLVQNAVQHTPAGGLVTVAITRQQEGACIEVEDTGEGISPDDLPHIWEKYSRPSKPREAARQGAGLGLSLVKELVEAMSGSVSVESCPGQGSTFRIYLPVPEA